MLGTVNVANENMHFKLGFLIIFVVNYVVHPAEAVSDIFFHSIFIAHKMAFLLLKALTLEQMNQTMLGVRAVCQPRFNLDDDAVDGIKKGNFSNEMNLKVFAVFPVATRDISIVAS